MILRDSRFRFLLFLLLNISYFSVYSQGQVDQNWYFGNSSRAIQFSRPGDTARLITRPAIPGFGTAGSAVASDPTTGGLLFYTDGVNVYDATHRVMPNGTGLQGNAAGNQPAVICKVPGQTNQYYVITNSATTGTPGSIRYSIIDMTQPGNNVAPAPALGDVGATKASDLNITTLTNQSEAMILIPHSNGTDFWLVTQQAGTNTFMVTAITAAGFSAPITVTPAGHNVSFSASQFAYHPGSDKLAVAPSAPNQNVMVYDFNEATGSLTFDDFVFNSAVTGTTAQPAIFDVEWSNTGEFLYVSRPGDAGVNADVLQYDMVNDNVSPVTVLTSPVAKSYGLQIAPDSSVYHIYQATAGGPYLVGRITDPDTVATAVNYQALPFGNVDFNATQFPSFMATSDPEIILDFTVSGTCANSPSSFFPTVQPGADSLAWDFGDGTGSSTNWSPTYTYSQGGSMPVTLYAIVGGDTIEQITKNIQITQFDLQITLVQDTTACSCELKFPKADPPPPPCNPFTLTAEASGQTGNIQWYGPSGLLAGQNTLTLSAVDSAGFYYVVVQDAGGSGCAAYAGVNIKEYGVDDPRSNIWYFGNGAGINFNPDFKPDTGADPIPGDVTSAEGVAVIADRNGQIIISTNGEQVFDREGNPAPLLPTGLGGSQNSTQSSLIIPAPGDPTLYYIFVTSKVYPDAGQPEYELRYAIFDLKRGVNGELVPMDPPANTVFSQVLFTKSTERITGNENWLIAHEYGTNNFRAYPITAEGLGAPVISSVGSDHSLAVRENAEGYMKLSPNNILAVALSTPGTSNVVELFDFDNATGAVTNPRTVDLQTPNGQVYGIEFSPSGTKMYASTIGPGSTLYEFAYDSATSNYTTRLPIQPPVPGEIGAIERGPDGTIYVATNGSSTLGTINPNPDIETPSTYNPTGFALFPGTTSTLGLPNFIQNIADPTQTPTISATGVCFGSPTLFQGSGTDVIDTLTWFFGDGSSQSGANLTEVEHTYAAPGEYRVVLRISNRCVGFVQDLDTLVTISPIPTALTGAISLCTGAEEIEATPANDPNLADLTFEWSTGQTTRTIIPPRQAIYNVTVTSSAGCSAEGEWLVADNRPQLELGPDQTICENTGTIMLDAQNVGSTYEWRRNGTIIGTEQTVGVRTNDPSPPAYKYSVRVFNPFTGCTARDSVTFTINPDPAFTTQATNPTVCNAADGIIELQITTPGTYTYEVTGRTPVPGGANITGPTGLIVTSNQLQAGGYNVLVTDQVTGCFERATVGLSDASFTASIAPAECNEVGSRRVAVILTTDAPTPYSYEILSAISTGVATSGTNITTSPVTTTPIPQGNFVAEVTSSAGCVFVTPSTTIRPQRSYVPIDQINIEECATPPSIEVVTSVTTPTYAWTGNGIPASQINLPRITPTGVTGPQEYTLVLTATNFCPIDTTINVNIQNNPVAQISQSDPCQDQVILSAAPTGNYVYRWIRNGAPYPGGQQISLSPADNGATFIVEAMNTLNGCVIQSADTVVAVLGELTVDITNPQPCQGTDFTLTANPSQAPDIFGWALNNTLISGAAGPTLVVTDDKSGLYRVTIQKSAAGKTCIAKDSVQINVAPTTAGVLTDTGIICPDEANLDPNTRTVTLNPGEGFISYNWFKDGVELGVTDPTYEATEIGTYTVELINAYNCPSSDKITLIEECDPRISGPNAFRPDGLNKEFFLYTFFIADEDFEVYIFNRWGEMVYYSDQRDFKWNGTNKSGQLLPPGTYSYLVKYKSSYRPELGVEEVRGGVVLLR